MHALVPTTMAQHDTSACIDTERQAYVSRATRTRVLLVPLPSSATRRIGATTTVSARCADRDTQLDGSSVSRRYTSGLRARLGASLLAGHTREAIHSKKFAPKMVDRE